jgi:multidrug transporter EmrE-like cation transporter
MKYSSQYPVYSLEFSLCYLAALAILLIYSFFWQIIIAQIDLSTAYANRGIVVLWSLLWSVVLFEEKLTTNNLIGSGLIIVGISSIGSKY